MVDTGTVNSGQWTVDTGTVDTTHSGNSEQRTQRTVDTVDSGQWTQWTQWTQRTQRTQRTQYPVDTAHSELYFAVFNNRVSIAQTVLFDTTSVVKITVPSVFTI